MSEPQWYALAVAELGVKEGAGASDNPHVLQYYRDAGHPEVKHDAVAWCAAFVGAMLKRAGIKPSGALNARSYLTWGKKLVEPKQGCVVVFSRGGSSWSGHVTFFDKWLTPGHIMRCLGGNQADSVNEEPFGTAHVLGYRWPSDDGNSAA